MSVWISRKERKALRGEEAKRQALSMGDGATRQNLSEELSWRIADRIPIL